jgi:hypothetical protein
MLKEDDEDFEEDEYIPQIVKEFYSNEEFIKGLSRNYILMKISRLYVSTGES